LGDCCKKDPSQRLTFNQITDKYEKLKQFHNILEELEKTDAIIEEIWNDAMSICTASNRGFEFNSFFSFLIEHFSLTQEKHEEQRYYLKQALRLPFGRMPLNRDPDYISREYFGIVCNLFKFTDAKDPGFIERILDVFKAEWFYGCVDREDVQRKIEDKSQKDMRGSSGWIQSILSLSGNSTISPVNFIVRYANSKRFCFTYKMKDTWYHNNIEPQDAYKRHGYSNFVSEYAKATLSWPTPLKYTVIPNIEKSFVPYKAKKH